MIAGSFFVAEKPNQAFMLSQEKKKVAFRQFFRYKMNCAVSILQVIRNKAQKEDRND